jgi:lipopolysaccharide biosynthesis glycosyltransferase
MSVFYQKTYINLLKLLIKSMSIKSNINTTTTDILIITSPTFQPLIQKELLNFTSGNNCILSIHYYILNLTTLFEAGCARLNIFQYDKINQYDKILYLDTDILINSDINILFNLDILPNKIYALEEGTIGHRYWGGMLFNFNKNNINKTFTINQTAFTSAILYFHNTLEIQKLFQHIIKHINLYIYINKNTIPKCLDQPFVVYNAFIYDQYDNQLLKLYCENIPSFYSKEKIIYHFPCGPGNYEYKYKLMNTFWEQIANITIDIKKSDISKSDISKSDISKSDISKSDISKSDISKSDISKSDISKSDIP